jgi:hypothetical protein
MLGAEAIPDPTTAADFCRRFDGEAVGRLMRIFNLDFAQGGSPVQAATG